MASSANAAGVNFQGSMVALVTPMHPDGSLDFDGLRKLIDWHIAEGTDSIVIVGTTGGGPAQSTQVLALWSYQQSFSNHEFGLGNAIATVLFAVITALFAWGAFAGIKRHPYGAIYRALLRPRQFDS